MSLFIPNTTRIAIPCNYSFKVTLWNKLFQVFAIHWFATLIVYLHAGLLGPSNIFEIHVWNHFARLKLTMLESLAVSRFSFGYLQNASGELQPPLKYLEWWLVVCKCPGNNFRYLHHNLHWCCTHNVANQNDTCVHNFFNKK